MANSRMNEVIDHLRRTVLLHDGAGLTDGQLLENFICRRDEAAVAALARRHASMVWSVCRRVLRHHHDAEDAFQATFLVLVRKAASIVPREMLANWLYGVAHQTALNAKEAAITRRGRERQIMDMPEPKIVEQDRSHGLQPLLDQELSRLPDKYRVAIVLCDLEGRTRKEAASQLKIPEGTLSSRLATAKVMLAKRLARHGLAVTGGSVATVLPQQASASVLASLLHSTIKAVTLVAAGEMATTGQISANVAALTVGVVKSMLLKKLRTATAVLLMLGMVALMGAMLAWSQTGNNGNGVQKPAAKAEKQAGLALADDVPSIAQKKDPPKYFTNSIGMKFAWIPPGTFMMGSPKEEEGRELLRLDETRHKVTLTKGFYMSVYTVTQEQFKEIMGNNPSRFEGEKNLPVERVSWEDCQEFAKKLREKDKKLYRLPTEAEWEYGCRAGTKAPFHFGETISTDQANYNGDRIYGNGKQGVYRRKTTPVDSFPANAWGLHDMHGNVWQWCQDWYGNYSRNDEVNPQGPKTGSQRVVRGGSWDNGPICSRSACRERGEPDDRSQSTGFRLCFFLD